MSWGSPLFVIAIIAISTGGWLISSWIRARHGYPLENEWSGTTLPASATNAEAERKIALLSSENENLQGKVSRLENRIAVLEKIVTDPAHRTAAAIDALR